MKISETILYKLALEWPSQMKNFEKVLGDDILGESYNLKYALNNQFLRNVREGIKF